MKTVNPTRESISALGRIPGDTPIVMVNLLRFRDMAAYPPGSSFEECTGRQAYRRYMEQVAKPLGEVGAKAVWLSRVLACVIAPEDEQWDQVLLVRYPSVDAFLAMIRIPAYLAASVHREAALEDSRLIATAETMSGLE
ncbi:MAG TPA: DUF1330 domain-containing protein [Deltaproteobacteria bacterium]|nr:DUF1330 domain-containing protein [Deltaproteobacteria bacterium]